LKRIMSDLLNTMCSNLSYERIFLKMQSVKLYMGNEKRLIENIELG